MVEAPPPVPEPSYPARPCTRTDHHDYRFTTACTESCTAYDDYDTWAGNYNHTGTADNHHHRFAANHYHHNLPDDDDYDDPHDYDHHSSATYDDHDAASPTPRDVL